MGKLYIGSAEPSKFYVGTEEVKKLCLGSDEIWSANSMPDWINPSIRNILDSLTPEAAYYLDFAYAGPASPQGFSQFYYRIYCSINSTIDLWNGNSMYMTLANQPSGFRGFSYYSWGFSTANNVWGNRYHYRNKSQCDFYDTLQGSIHRAFIEGTITTVNNQTGYTFEDLRS